MNLKQILMELGNRLVTERGFAPGADINGTGPITEFTEWLNRTPDAVEVLDQMGIAWPVVQKPAGWARPGVEKRPHNPNY